MSEILRTLRLDRLAAAAGATRTADILRDKILCAVVGCSELTVRSSVKKGMFLVAL